MTPTQIHWIRKESGLVDSSFVRYYCQWYRTPNIGCVLKSVRFYKSIDLPVYAPMLSHEIFLSLCPSISREDFDEIVTRCYDKKTQDRGAQRAFTVVSENYDLVALFRDKWVSNLQPDCSSTLWKGCDIGNIRTADIAALQKTLDIEIEWIPQAKKHSSWIVDTLLC